MNDASKAELTNKCSFSEDYRDKSSAQQGTNNLGDKRSLVQVCPDQEQHQRQVWWGKANDNKAIQKQKGKNPTPPFMKTIDTYGRAKLLILLTVRRRPRERETREKEEERRWMVPNQVRSREKNLINDNAYSRRNT
jgi:hypothetical protein